MAILHGMDESHYKFFIMSKDRFNVIKESKFERLSNNDLESIKGGLCLSCKQRSRNFEVGGGKEWITTPYGDRVEIPVAWIRWNF